MVDAYLAFIANHSFEIGLLVTEMVGLMIYGILRLIVMMGAFEAFFEIITSIAD